MKERLPFLQMAGVFAPDFTLRAGNTSKIWEIVYKIDFIFEKSTKRVDYKYDFMSYRGSENNPPRSIGDLISEKFYTEM